MKRTLFFFPALLSLFLLPGCGSVPQQLPASAPLFFGEESSIQGPPAGDNGAAGLFEHALPLQQDAVSPFDLAAIDQELEALPESLLPLYRQMARRDDLNNRIFRPTAPQLAQVLDALGATGRPVLLKDNGLQGPEPLRAFYEEVLAGRDSSAVLYETDETANLVQVSFLFEEGKLYCMRVPFGWNLDLLPFRSLDVPFFPLDYLFLTEKGYLMYGNEKDGFARMAGGYRLTALEEENYRLQNLYLEPLEGYYGHNLLTCSWEQSDLSPLALNDAFDALSRYHAQVTGDYFLDEDSLLYSRWVPAGEFEEVITSYFPITPEKLRQIAVYDSARNVYPATPFLNSGYPLQWEVSAWQQNPDGSLTLTVDAMSLSHGQDCLATSLLTVLPTEAGHLYLSNEFTLHSTGRDWFPSYRPRMGQLNSEG